MSTFKDSERGFEDTPRHGRTITTITGENAKAVEQIVLPDRQNSVRRANMKKSISGKSFESDDEAIATGEDSLTDLKPHFFRKA